jgi:hypothetical protein
VDSGQVKRLGAGPGIGIRDDRLTLSLRFSPSQGSGNELWTGTRLRSLQAGDGVSVTQTDDSLTISSYVQSKPTPFGQNSLVDQGKILNFAVAYGIRSALLTDQSGRATTLRVIFNPDQGAGVKLWNNGILSALSGTDGITVTAGDTIVISGTELQTAIAELQAQVNSIPSQVVTNTNGTGASLLTPSSQLRQIYGDNIQAVANQDSIRLSFQPPQIGDGTALWNGNLRKLREGKGVFLTSDETSVTITALPQSRRPVRGQPLVVGGEIMCLSGSRAISLTPLGDIQEMQISFTPGGSFFDPRGEDIVQLWDGETLYGLRGIDGISLFSPQPGVRNSIHISGAAIQQSVASVQQSVTSVQQSVTSIQQSVTSVQQSVTSAQQSVTSVSGRVTTLENRNSPVVKSIDAFNTISYTWARLGTWDAPPRGHILKLNVVTCGFTCLPQFSGTTTVFHQPLDLTVLMNSGDGTLALQTDVAGRTCSAVGYGYFVCGYAAPLGIKCQPDPSVRSRFHIWMQLTITPGQLLVNASTTSTWTSSTDPPTANYPSGCINISLVPVQTLLSTSLNYARVPSTNLGYTTNP